MLKAHQPGRYSRREPQKILEIKSLFFKHQMKTSEVGALWRQESFLNQGFYKKLRKIISHKTEQRRTIRAKFQSSYKNKENKEQNNIPRLRKHKRKIHVSQWAEEEDDSVGPILLGRRGSRCCYAQKAEQQPLLSRWARQVKVLRWSLGRQFECRTNYKYAVVFY